MMTDMCQPVESHGIGLEGGLGTRSRLGRGRRGNIQEKYRVLATQGAELSMIYPSYEDSANVGGVT